MARLDTPGEVVEIIGSVALNEPVVTSKQRTCKFGNEFQELLNSEGPAVFIVKLDPDQLYFPKIGSRINKSGVMASSPLHMMDPPLDQEQAARFLKYV